MDELEICDVSMSSLMVGNLCIFSCFEHMSPTSILWEIGFQESLWWPKPLPEASSPVPLQCNLCCGKQRRDPND